MKHLYLCGGGNAEGVRLALNVQDATKRWEKISILDDDVSKHGSSVLGVSVEGSFSVLAEVHTSQAEAVNLVARSTKGRRGAEEKIASFGVPFFSLVDPNVDTRGVELGDGVTIYRNATVSALARIGSGSVIFAGANAGHGSLLGAGSVLAPGAVINARVVTGEGVYVGTNASVLPDLRIGAWATIAANSSVIEDVPESATALGVPAQLLLVASREDPAHPFIQLTDERALNAIREVWRALLEVDEIGIDDNFFDIGGTSLLAVQMRALLQNELEVPVAGTDIFRFPTIRALANYFGPPEATGYSRAAERARTRLEFLHRRRPASTRAQL